MLKDRVWTMLSEVAKRGVYPLHGNKLGIFRMPIDITDRADFSGIMNDLRSSGFKMDTHADRIYVTYKWTEKGNDPVTGEDLSADVDVTVEVVTGEVVDLIYQIKQVEYFGDVYWIKDYRAKAEKNAKMVIDTIIRNTKVGDKLIAYYQKIEKLTAEAAIKKLEEVAPLAKNPKPRSAIAPPPAGPSAAPRPAAAAPPPMAAQAAAGGGNTTIALTGSGTGYGKVDGPIDTKFKEKRQQAGTFQGIKVWGPVDPPGQLGIWGESVTVDFDICIADGACIEACPVNVYEWLDTPGHASSERKPFMKREKDCIFCLACENVCPPQAIKIFKKG